MFFDSNQRFRAPSMRTRWGARDGVCRAVASGLCVERGGRDRAGARNRAKISSVNIDCVWCEMIWYRRSHAVRVFS